VNMEWDRITEEWAAMAQRLRCDRSDGHLRATGDLKGRGREATGPGMIPSGKISPGRTTPDRTTPGRIGHDSDLASLP